MQYYGINNGIMYDYDSCADIGMLSDEYSVYQPKKTTYMTQLDNMYYYDNYNFEEEDQEQEVDDFLF